jgi:DNA-binding LacI/PurR family transcriptional regulator
VKKPAKASSLIDYVAAHVATGYYAPGSKIPSIRRLAQKFGVSYGTAFRGIEYLNQAGIISRHPKRGYRVLENHREENSLIRIAVFVTPYATEDRFVMCYNTFMQIQELCYQNGCCLMPILLQNPEISLEKIRQVSEGVQGIIFLNEYDAYLPTYDIPLPAAGTLIQKSFDGRIAVVGIDPFAAAEKAAEYFVSRKVHRVIIGSATAPVYIRRGEAFEMYWRRQGGECVWNFDWKGKIKLAEGEGAFFTSDHFAECHIRIMEEDGYDLTAHPICSVDGKQLLTKDFHRFPTIAVDWRLVGRTVFEEVFRQIKFPDHPVRNIALTGKWIMP